MKILATFNSSGLFSVFKRNWGLVLVLPTVVTGVCVMELLDLMAGNPVDGTTYSTAVSLIAGLYFIVPHAIIARGIFRPNVPAIWVKDGHIVFLQPTTLQKDLRDIVSVYVGESSDPSARYRSNQLIIDIRGERHRSFDPCMFNEGPTQIAAAINRLIPEDR